MWQVIAPSFTSRFRTFLRSRLATPARCRLETAHDSYGDGCSTTVTVDPALIRAGQDAVAAGRVESVSAWVNLALAERAAKERRLAAMADAIAAYEAKFGVISA